MISLLNKLALATLFSFALATPSMAAEGSSNGASRVSSAESSSLIAQVGPSDPQYDVRMLDEMIMSHLKMVQTAQAGLQSQSPEIRRMSQEMITSMNAQIERMITMRRALFTRGATGGR
ncbi:DUF305 domain-containing protein [Leptolyngbya sp. FACHB-261]|uniref:DUF305 domain-containing protein n=1 Tax=Leptolyngbya sp. FACHB-261 TaxID=2692806 RepID=UPI001688B33A|nr:DUF305 domain-containing protein [Leptolyngbya sp. FACHB-261]MBD2101637.1 DUF305 domain-containing protein [Leptolyngbya sp. FACHB-261]